MRNRTISRNTLVTVAVAGVALALTIRAIAAVAHLIQTIAGS